MKISKAINSGAVYAYTIKAIPLHSLFQLPKMMTTATMDEKQHQEDIFHSPERTVEEEDEVNDEERKRVVLLRATLEKKDQSSKYLDDPTLRRFLRARDHHVEKASLMATKYLIWRRTFVPRGSVSESEIPNELAQNKVFLQGRDKQGRPIVVVFGSRHFPCKGGIDEFRRMLVYCLDKVSRSIPDGQEKFTIIGDLQGYGYCNSDFCGSLAALNILQDYYPERLGKLYNIHVPYVFMAMWKIVCPFIDKNTKKKIVFVENKRLRETLLEDIDESQLPEIYGGKLPLLPIHMAS